jgi:hypothetical protein
MFNLPSNALCLVCDASLIGRLADADGGRSSRRLSARERVQRVEHCDRDEQMLFSGHVERHDAVGLDTGFIRHAGQASVGSLPLPGRRGFNFAFSYRAVVLFNSERVSHSAIRFVE